MKTLKVTLAFVVVLFIASACHRVKCPSDTFTKAEIEQQNTPQE